MLASATARAVAFSALTTGTAFGSLALSGHPGTASMGALLLISLGCTLTASLVFVPALLAALERAPADGALRIVSRMRQMMLQRCAIGAVPKEFYRLRDETKFRKPSD
jgi:uncharacterized membrane protein YdfJ with MMPL/SSD domain